MSQRPRALFLTPVFPRPDGSGPAQRAHQWLRVLAADFDLSVLVVHRRREDVCDAHPVAEVPVGTCRSLCPTPGRWDYWYEAIRAVAATWTGRREFAFVGWGREWAFLNPAGRSQVTTWFGGIRWDRVVAFRLQVFDYAAFVAQQGWVERDQVILDLDDLESTTRASLARGLARMGRWREATLTKLDAWHAADVERKVMRVFPRVTVAAPEDRSWIEQTLPDARPKVFPNRIFRLPARLTPADPRRILFLGTLAYFPNEESVRFMAGIVLPRLRRDDARWTLIVGGFGASAALRHWLENQPGVEMRGAVEHVGDLYRDTGLFAAPVFSGGGTKIKVIEALAHGLPVIASGHAVRGLALRPTVDFWPAESTDEWLEACRRLAEDRALAAALAASGREAVRAGYVYGSD